MKNIIFDLGGVLIFWNPDTVYEKYFGGNLDKMSRFYKETEIFKANAEMDRGRPFQEILSELANNFPHYHEPIQLWKSNWPEMIGGPIDATVEILEILHVQGYQLYALTNFSAEMFFSHICHNPKYSFLDRFRDIVVSGVEQTIKPEPKIYNILLQRNKLDPNNCIYIDDTANNLIPAQKLGMATIRFNSPNQLIQELKSLGVSVATNNQSQSNRLANSSE